MMTEVCDRLVFNVTIAAAWHCQIFFYEGCGRVRQVTWQGLSCAGFLKPTQQQQPQQQSEHADLPLGSRLSSYTSAASRSATPKANAESSSWNGSLDSSASYAAVQVR